MEELNTFEVFYKGPIDGELDEAIETYVIDYLEAFMIKAEWYYSEFTVSNPTYRLIGFELNTQLTELQRLSLISDMSIYFEGIVNHQ